MTVDISYIIMFVISLVNELHNVIFVIINNSLFSFSVLATMLMVNTDLISTTSCPSPMSITASIYKVAQKWHNFCTPKLYQILTDFQNYFTVRIRRKFVTMLSLKIPPRLKCVAGGFQPGRP